MHFRIDDTFRNSLTRLTNEEQKAVKTTFFDLVSQRHGRGLRLKKLRGGNWSARVNHDIRIIADWNERENDLCLRYVGRHDEAYQWAKRHKAKIRTGDNASEDAKAMPSVQEVPDVASTQRKTVRFRLLSFAERRVDTCLTSLSTLRNAIANARDGKNGQNHSGPTANQPPPKGAAEVRKLFEISNVGTVAGCYVLDGKIARDDRIRIIRGGEMVYTGTIDSLERRRKKVHEIRRRDECGIGIWSYPEIQIGDRIESY